MAAKWLFDCPRKGHSPIAGAPTSLTEFGKDVYIGQVCVKCGSVWYQKTEDFTPTRIISV